MNKPLLGKFTWVIYLKALLNWIMYYKIRMLLLTLVNLLKPGVPVKYKMSNISRI